MIFNRQPFSGQTKYAHIIFFTIIISTVFFIIMGSSQVGVRSLLPQTSTLEQPLQTKEEPAHLFAGSDNFSPLIIPERLQANECYHIYLPIVLASGTAANKTNSNTHSSTSQLDCPSEATGIEYTSPANGEDGVAVTRETIIEFNEPIDPATVTSSTFSAKSNGASLANRLHISPDNKRITLFYDNSLPAEAEIQVTINGNAITDANGELIDVDDDGQPGGVITVNFRTLSLTPESGTSVCGRVLASELAEGDSGSSIDVPLAGVTITVDGAEETLRTVTDADGYYCLDPAPGKRFFVHIDGRTATNGVPHGAYYPFVGKAWKPMAGQRLNLSNIYLPLVIPGTLQAVSETTDTTIQFPPAVLADFPEFADVSITVPAGSLFANDGSPGGMVGIAPVPPSRLPGRLPPQLQFPLVITVQSDGATNFDTPAPVCFPNLPDPQTNELLEAGAKSGLWSFNHDTGRWKLAGPMTVSSDGRLVCTNSGTGVQAPGWGGHVRGLAVGVALVREVIMMIQMPQPPFSQPAPMLLPQRLSLHNSGICHDPVPLQ